jgi:hypothetical protein
LNIFGTIQQGDSATWNDEQVTLADGVNYNSTAFTLKYELRGPGNPLTLTAAANGSGWTTTMTTAQSEGLTPGKWWWAAFYSATGIRTTAGQGEFTSTPDIGAAAGVFDGSTAAEIALKAAEAALASFTSSNGKIKKYTIGSRSMEFATVPEILQVISYWKARVATEQSAKSIAQGLGDPRRLFVRFNR